MLDVSVKMESFVLQCVASTNTRLKWKYHFNLNYSIYYHKHHNKQLLNFRMDLLLAFVFNRSFIHV